METAEQLIVWSMSFLVVSILTVGQDFRGLRRPSRSREEHHGPRRPSRSPCHSHTAEVHPEHPGLRRLESHRSALFRVKGFLYIVDRDGRQGHRGRGQPRRKQGFQRAVGIWFFSYQMVVSLEGRSVITTRSWLFGEGGLVSLVSRSCSTAIGWSFILRDETIFERG